MGVAGLLSVVLTACGERRNFSPTRAYQELTGFAMGTTWSLKYEGSTNPDDLKALRKSLDDRLEELENQMSTWREDSQISRFNSTRSTNWFPVSADMVRVVAAAELVSRKTDGAFDITTYPLVRLWGFGSAEVPDELPDTEAIAAARRAVGYRNLEHREDPPGLRKSLAELQIDVSAIAKGFAVDQLVEMMERGACTNYLVEIGGELRASGQREQGGPWRVGIEDPVVGKSRIEEVLPLKNAALASSGDYRNFLDINGRRFAHIVDPKSGRPLPQRDLAVSVLRDNCMSADAWATALTVLGPQAGLEIANSNGLPVMFRHRMNGAIKVLDSEHWPARSGSD